MRTPRPNPERDANLEQDKKLQAALIEYATRNGEMPTGDYAARIEYQKQLHAFLVFKGLRQP